MCISFGRLNYVDQIVLMVSRGQKKPGFVFLLYLLWFLTAVHATSGEGAIHFQFDLQQALAQLAKWLLCCFRGLAVLQYVETVVIKISLGGNT